MSSPSPYSFKQRMLLRFGVPLAVWALRLLASSWRTQVIDPSGAQPSRATGPMVYGMWHGDLLAVTGQWRGTPTVQGLASQSFDGELISQAMLRLGYPMPSRGSSSRGGAQGLAAQMDAIAAGNHAVVTMDGPRGPRHVAKAGAATIAARSQRPLVPLVCVARPALTLRNWDQTVIPWPFAKLVFQFGTPIHVVEEDVATLIESLPEKMTQLETQARQHLG